MKLVLPLVLALGAAAQEPGEVASFDAELAMDHGNCVDISYWDEVGCRVISIQGRVQGDH